MQLARELEDTIALFDHFGIDRKAKSRPIADSPVGALLMPGATTKTRATDQSSCRLELKGIAKKNGPHMGHGWAMPSAVT